MGVPAPIVMNWSSDDVKEWVVCSLSQWADNEDAPTFDQLGDAEAYALTEWYPDGDPLGIWDAETDELLAIVYDGETFAKQAPRLQQGGPVSPGRRLIDPEAPDAE